MEAAVIAKDKGATRAVELVLCSFSVLLVLGLLGLLAHYSSYGIDFTDESLYLVWMANPFLYDWSISEFGFIYHPLYKIFGGNISAIRQANIFITYVLAWGMVDAFFRHILLIGGNGKWPRLILSAGFATAALLVFDTWLVTPGYNSLNLQALLIALTGLFLLGRSSQLTITLGASLIALGGWLVFMAKPSSAVALFICLALYLYFSGKLSRKLSLLVLSLGFVLFGLGALLIDGSVVAFIQRLKSGSEILQYFGKSYEWSGFIRLDGFFLNRSEQIVFGVFWVISLIAMLGFNAKSQLRGASIALVMVCCLFLAGLLVMFGFTGDITWLGKFKGMLLLVIPLTVFPLFLTPFFQGKDLSGITCDWKLLVLLVFLPGVYAFGTNQNYWQATSPASIFWILASLLLLIPMLRNANVGKVLFPLAISLQVIVVLLLQSGLAKPYRQPQPLRQNNYLTQFGSPNSTLRLADSFGTYLSDVMTTAQDAHWIEGTPVIDLSGRSPGVLYALRAKSIGLAWMIGGYPGSEQLAVSSLKRMSCQDIGRAWVLVEPGGERSLSGNVLNNFGANLLTDYSEVGSWTSPKGVGGSKQAIRQKLLKPSRDFKHAISNCEGAQAK